MKFIKHKKQKSERIKSRFDNKEAKRKKRSITKILTEFLLKAGIDKTPLQINKAIIKIDIIISIVLTLGLIAVVAFQEIGLTRFFLLLVVLWTVVLATLYLLTIISYLLYLDMKIYKRTKQIEEVLPDFLQLTSANISAGMPIDRALWLAVRPRFGVLAKEMEEIAKQTATGEDLEIALNNFSKKYNSRVLKESVNLLIAGLEAGGEIGELLNKIATNIQEIKIMRKEIGASVTTYTIFIAAASIFAAPLLYALSIQLLGVIQHIVGGINLDSAATSGSIFSFSISKDAIAEKDFQTFTLVLLATTSFFSAAITSVIKKGNMKAGLKNIPVYFIVSMLIYFVSKIILGGVFAGMF